MVTKYTVLWWSCGTRTEEEQETVANAGGTLAKMLMKTVSFVSSFESKLGLNCSQKQRTKTV